MFALGLHYLNGWSMAASDGARKERAEWPPHPDRVFMALAAAWFETGEDNEEGAALRWLEGLPPPSVAASDASQRSPVVSYVPVNDLRVGGAPSESSLSKLSDFKQRHDKLKEAGLALVPEHRLRQGRGFPVAVPHDPTVHLIWRQPLDGHGDALARLAGKVTHVGHSASFVQAWVVDGCDLSATWEPTAGLATHRLRIPSMGRLDRLAKSCTRGLWIAYHDLRYEIFRAEADLKAMKQPPRVAWPQDFPDAVLLAPESQTRQHPEYAAAKSGDAAAARRLVDALVEDSGLAAVRSLLDGATDGRPMLVSAHAYEREGFNAIPPVLAHVVSGRLGTPFDTSVVQTNIVGHTGADGYGRLGRQAAFDGVIERGRQYVMVDDFIGQGGTLANLRGWVEKKGGTVVGAVGLTGKPYSAKLKVTKEQIHELRQRHGREFEKWWREHFGHPFDCLTQSEARYLSRSPDVDTIRDRLAAAMRERGGRSFARSPREQRSHIRELKAGLAERFPDGEPRRPARPAAGRWQGYARPRQTERDVSPQSVFDPRIVVLAIQGRRVSLPSTLKLTAALRGLLMRECRLQPPPEWFSGHRCDGKPTVLPHVALAPLPFVGAPHADGRIMGLALILPRELNPDEAGRGLNPILHEPDTGLPRAHRLFDGQWLECAMELDTRERPPVNLNPQTWTSCSRTWASVTPVVLNRHFDGRDRWARAAESLKDACRHIGLPRPAEILLHPVSLVEAVPHAREFPRLTRKRDNGHQSHAHAVIVFDVPVTGPVLVGAGRFRGYGLCRPVDPQ